MQRNIASISTVYNSSYLDKDSTTALIYIGLQIGLRSFGLLAREIQAAL